MNIDFDIQKKRPKDAFLITYIKFFYLSSNGVTETNHLLFVFFLNSTTPLVNANNV